MSMATGEAPRIGDDREWGCYYNEIINSEVDVKSCIIHVKSLEKIALALTGSVLNESWMLKLDKRTQRSYRFTVKETAAALVEIFNKIKADPTSDSALGEEFGEIMVSMGASRALAKLFEHESIPIAELWKPQKKQNEGFDFHTVCPQELINFGEAKYSGSSNPHGDAISQIIDFLAVEKHLRDANHLTHLVHENAACNLDDDKFGVIAAFSINSSNYDLIMKNALTSITQKKLIDKCSFIYLVGVIVK